MAARSVYSDKELHGKHSSDKKEMLQLKGISWDLYPSFFKRGSYIQKRAVIRPFTTEELSELPEKHEARINPKLTFVRGEHRILEFFPPFIQIENKQEFIFEGAEPIEKSSSSQMKIEKV
jgi:hypothetical protein